MLLWIIQEGFQGERGYDVLLDTMERFNLDHVLIKVVPFSRELIPEPKPQGNCVVMGSIGLGKAAVERHWYPGCFTNDNFHYSKWQQHLGPHLVSPDLAVCRFEDVPAPQHEFFIRPCLDDKSFSGAVMQPQEFLDWRDKVLALRDHYTTLDANTEVAFGPVKQIYREYRFFVLDGEVVTGSQYRLGPRVVINPEVSPVVLQFANEMVRTWQPDRAFALDIAETPDGLKVIEIGCFNGCGFYAADVQKLVMRVEASFA